MRPPLRLHPAPHRRRPLWWGALAFAFGVGAAALTAPPWPAMLALLAGATLTLVVLLARERRGRARSLRPGATARSRALPRGVRVLLVLAASAAGALALSWQRRAPPDHSIRRLALPAGRAVTVRARVIEPPVAPLGSQPPPPSFLAELTALATEVGRVPIDGRAWVHAGRYLPQAEPGALLELTGTWATRDDDARREGGARAGERRFDGVLRLASPARVTVIEAPAPTPALLAARARRAFLRAAFAHLSAESAALYAALIAGERSYLSETARARFERSGTLHLLAISGLHVLLVAGLFHLLLRLLRVPLRARWVATIAFLPAYALFAGGAPSVVRATVLGVCAAAAPLAGRRTDGLNLLGLAALVILAVDPEALPAPGFQLSFAAVLGIFALNRVLPIAGWRPGVDADGAPPPWWRLALWRIARGAVMIVLVSLAATLATLPLMLLHFHAAAPGAPVVNLLAVPALAVLLAAGWMLAVAAALGTPPALLSAVVDALPGPVVRALDAAVAGGLDQSYAFGAHPLPALAALIALAALVAARRRPRPARLAIGVLAVVNALLLADFLGPAPEAGPWRIVAFDVGQGNATLVCTPAGKTLLYDCGAGPWRDPGRETVAPWLHRRGLRRIDLLVISHANRDHSSGVPSLVARVPVGRAVVPAGFGRDPGGRAVLGALADAGVPVTELHAGARWRDFGGLSLVVLAPRGTELFGEALRPNDRSLVLELARGPHRALLTGDLEDRGLGALLLSDALHPAGYDVLAAPHHGSALAQQARLLRAARPAQVLISATASFPNPDALIRYRRATAAAAGELVLSAEAGTAELVLRDGRWRVWHERVPAHDRRPDAP